MIELTINDIRVQVPDGTTVLEAARQMGIDIPTMCYLEGLPTHPSCMLCVVKDTKTGKIHPSCALKAETGQDIITHDSEIKELRREALELLLSDHVGDCEAPCRTSCPAFMDIPKMNRLIAKGKFAEALKVVKEEIALPLILGYICPAPCEKACRRGQVDEPVSICKLKRLVAEEDLTGSDVYLPMKKSASGKKVAIVGTGPAGLSCAYHLLAMGHDCVLYDKNPDAGGALRYSIPDEKLPKSALDAEIGLLKNLGATFIMNTDVTPELFENELKMNFKAVVLATGDFQDSRLSAFGLPHDSNGLTVNRDTMQVDEQGVFACGNIIRSRRMAVTSVAQGKAAAHSVDLYIRGLPTGKIHRMFNSKFGKLFEEEIVEYQKEIATESGWSPRVETTYSLTIAQAKMEAGRCLHCDCRKPNTCKLRIYSDEYQVDRRMFSFGERSLVRKYDQHHLIIYEPEKCIKCNICVQISEQEQDRPGFTSVHRGFEVEMGMPLNKSMADLPDHIALRCTNACPTGAISLKNEQDE
jgi:ferredoxin